MTLERLCKRITDGYLNVKKPFWMNGLVLSNFQVTFKLF